MSATFGCRGQTEKVGVLLAQLGTPDSPDAKGLRKYLGEFLADPRVVEVNRVLWWFILNGIILRTRPKRSAALYKRVWTEDGSPLLQTTKHQATLLAEALRRDDSVTSDDIAVVFGMRYGNPSIASALDSLIHQGCSRILLFPLYPQYAAATSASTYDSFFSHLLRRRWVPAVRVVDAYYSHPGYLQALAQRINSTIASLPQAPERLLLSFHGVPQAYVDKGDPYCCNCTETVKHLKPLIQFPANLIQQTFQSRFGKEPWLEPYTDETIRALAKQGIKRIAVACPGFVADCLETIDEIGHEAKKLFQEEGGDELTLIPCVNESPAWIEAMKKITIENLSGWVGGAARTSSTCECPVKQFVTRKYI